VRELSLQVPRYFEPISDKALGESKGDSLLAGKVDWQVNCSVRDERAPGQVAWRVT
jgi:hypothetical protein